MVSDLSLEKRKKDVDPEHIKIAEEMIVNAANEICLDDNSIYRLKNTKVSIKDVVTVDIYLIIKFGTNIPSSAWDLQKKLKGKIKEITELEVNKINIHIDGVR